MRMVGPATEGTTLVRMVRLLYPLVLLAGPAVPVAQAPVQVCPLGVGWVSPLVLTVPVVVLRAVMAKMCRAWLLVPWLMPTSGRVTDWMVLPGASGMEK